MIFYETKWEIQKHIPKKRYEIAKIDKNKLKILQNSENEHCDIPIEHINANMCACAKGAALARSVLVYAPRNLRPMAEMLGELYNYNKTKKCIQLLVEGYKQLTKTIKMINKNGITHGCISTRTIMYDVDQHIPVLTHFFGPNCDPELGDISALNRVFMFWAQMIDLEGLFVRLTGAD